MKTAFEEMIEDELNGDTKSIDYYFEKEKEQITNAFIAGYQCAKMEDMIGGSGDEENEYYDETYK